MTDKQETIDTTRWIIVTCRLCGKKMLYPRATYREEDLIGWECGGLLSHSCKIAYERDKHNESPYI